MASHKIPKHVAQELKRHVQKPSSNNNNKTFALFGCMAFTALAAAMPYFATKWTGNLNSSENALTAAQTRRGAFNNSGTRDVGKDPNWDFTTGTYKRSRDFQTMMQQQSSKDIQHDDENWSNEMQNHDTNSIVLYTIRILLSKLLLYGHFTPHLLHILFIQVHFLQLHARHDLEWFGISIFVI